MRAGYSEELQNRLTAFEIHDKLAATLHDSSLDSPISHDGYNIFSHFLRFDRYLEMEIATGV